jgi:hypothetical protein
MKWRIIIHMKLADDRRRGSGLGNAITKCFKQCGISFVRHSSSWEGSPLTPSEVGEQMKRVLDLLADPKKSGYRAQLDHMLISIDCVKTP